MADLLEKKCVPCEGGIPPFSKEKEKEYINQVKGWSLIKEGIHRINREFSFEDFKEAMKFVNQVAELAEDEGHHPDIFIYYNQVILELHTHAIKGLHLNDFILAAKINELFQNESYQKS
ncbi:MAG: 4a-hydroxytetrahydrobiopterin dehydratase [Promethearchaeota archaeon]